MSPRCRARDWALMLIGFGAVGTALRRKQRQTAFAAA